VRQAYLAKATAGTLSPLMALVGQYLLYTTDYLQGRRWLLNVLFLEDSNSRMKIHNWAVLNTAPKGTDIKEGRKIEHLQVPLFPWGDHKLRELNAKILDMADSMEGAGPADGRLAQFFIRDDDFLRGSVFSGAGQKPVIDSQGRPTDFFIDVTDIENACNSLFCEVTNKADRQTIEQQVNGLRSAINQLKSSNSRRPPPHYQRDYYPQRSNGSWRSYKRGGFHGGEAGGDPQPKNLRGLPQ